MRTLPFGFSVELQVRPRNCERCAEIDFLVGGVTALPLAADVLIGAQNMRRACRNLLGGGIGTLPLGPSVGFPYGFTKRLRDAPR